MVLLNTPDETELFKEGLTLEVWTDYKKLGKLALKDTQRDILARIYFGGIQHSLRSFLSLLLI